MDGIQIVADGDNRDKDQGWGAWYNRAVRVLEAQGWQIGVGEGVE